MLARNDLSNQINQIHILKIVVPIILLLVHGSASSFILNNCETPTALIKFTIVSHMWALTVNLIKVVGVFGRLLIN